LPQAWFAFRTANDEQQQSWHDAIARVGLNVTPQLDRQYFHSISFREPGGVLFEIATDRPGLSQTCMVIDRSYLQSEAKA
jgi:glyoxalase family protein